MKSVGTPIDRIDAQKKVTGTATYAADTDVTKVAHGVIVTSTIAKGTIAGIELTAARQSPGVLAVLSHLDAPRVTAGKGSHAEHNPGLRVLQLLQSDAIDYADGDAGHRPGTRAPRENPPRPAWQGSRRSRSCTRAAGPSPPLPAIQRANLRASPASSDADPAQSRPPDANTNPPAADRPSSSPRSAENSPP